MLNSLRRWLNNIPISNPIERRQAPLLQIILLGLIAADVLSLLPLLMGGDLDKMIIQLIVLPICIVALWFIRRGKTRAGASVLISGLLAVVAANPLVEHGMTSTGLLSFMIPLALAGLLVGRGLLLTVAAVSAIIIAVVPSTDPDGGNAAFINILILGVITLLLDQFGSSLRMTLAAMLDREYALQTAQTALEERVAAEQTARAEAQRLHAEAQRRQQEEQQGRLALERAVAEYLSFVQRVGRGELDQQLPITQEGALGQLGLGLQQMATNLAELQQAEADNRRALEQAVATYLAFAEQVGAGKLAERISVSGNGALGSLGHGLNTMAERLHQLTTRVQQAAASIAASAAEILAATTQQSATAAEQAAAITQTTTTVEQVKQIALQTAEQAAQVAQASQQALTAARSGTAAVTQTVSGMDSIREQSDEIAQTILVLSERAQAISSIVTTVSELADQSNLLALNAAIEAARAGEQGKSFAVVAQHVRDLAERSKTATTQVRTILSQIQQATTTAIMVTEEGGKSVESGLQQATQAGDAITHLAGEIEGGAHTNTAMAAAAQQQLVGVEQIGQAIGAIQQATQQTLTSTRQAERAAKDLNALAQDLQKMIASYEI